MTKVLFVCHGNICRSPMAEFVLKDMTEKIGASDDFYIASAATSTEEIGNGVHPGTRKILSKLGIKDIGKYAIQIEKSDYEKYDYLIGMDHYNLHNMHRVFGGDAKGKIYMLPSFADSDKDISDPWYTGDFIATFRDVREGCLAFLDYLGYNLEELRDYGKNILD